MVNIVGDIAIAVGADIGPLVRELGKAQGAVDRFGNAAKGAASGGMSMAARAGSVLAVGVAAASTAMAVLTRRSLDNIDALSKQARVAGISVASFQAMAQVAAEAGVESEALSKTLIKMQDNIVGLQNGTTAQVDAFDRLGVSITQLQGLGADEQFGVIAAALDGITEPAARTAAALDIFGKSGAEALNMVSGYGAAIADAAAFQQEFGIAVSDLDAANVEAANDAMGRLWIATEGLGNTLAVTFAPALAAAATDLADFIAGLITTQTAMENTFGTDAIARSVLGGELYDRLRANVDAFAANADAIGALQGTLGALQGQATETGDALIRVARAVKDAGSPDLARGFADIAAEIRQSRNEFDDGRISADQYRAGLEAAIVKANGLLAAASAINGVDLSGARGEVAGLAAVLDLARRAANAVRAAITGAAVAEGAVQFGPGPDSRSPVVSPLAPQGGRATSAPQRAPTDPDFGLGDVSGGGGGGGGGGGESLQDRLARMQEEFATESEQLQAQFDERLVQLEEFRSAKLLSEEEFNALEAQVKQEHEEKLQGIEQDSRSARLQAVSGAFGDLASLMQSSNSKLFKIGQAAAIAEASISGYEAAVDAWKKGMKIGGPPVATAFAAASLVKTGSLIAKIASQSARGSGGGAGSGGGGGGGGAAVAASAAPTPANVNLTWNGAMTPASFRTLTEQLNGEYKQGYRLNFVTGSAG